MIDSTDEVSVFLVYETIDAEDMSFPSGYAPAEDVVRRVCSSLQNAKAIINNQVDPSLWWIEEWTVDE